MKMKNKIFIYLLIIGLLIGIGFVAYPSISNYINNLNNSNTILEYNNEVQTISNEQKEQLIDEATAYNKQLYPVKNNNDINQTIINNYDNIINIGNGLIGSIDIPKINVNLPIFHQSKNDENLKIGCEHLEHTSFPIGGKSTHCVISAHTGYPSQRLFTDLDKLEIGDVIKINVLTNELTYIVDEINIVEPGDTSKLQIVSGEDYLTLVTCYPYSLNTHRLCVRGSRADSRTTTATNDIVPVNNIKNNSFIIYTVIAISFIAVIAVTILIILLKKQRKQ